MGDLVSVKNESARDDLLFDANAAKAVTPLNPFRLNERLRTQKGVFLVPGDLKVSFMDNLTNLPASDPEESEPENPVLRLVLAPAIRKEALEHLYYMNISRTSLFPGLDGNAQSLGVYHSAFNPVAGARAG